jgi:hypothetical protein
MSIEDLQFVDELPERQRSRLGRPPNPAFDVLRHNPGKWAVFKRYPTSKADAARSYAWRTQSRHPGIETAVRLVDSECIVFARAIDPESNDRA